MKSGKIKVRNLPRDPGFIEKVVTLKPTAGLIVLFLIGGALLFTKAYLVALGVLLILLALFAVAVMPDRKLMMFTKEYLVFFNQRNRDICTLVYWDEILSWQYEYHKNYDLLVIHLSDGSTEKQETYSFRSIKRLMRTHAGDKQMKSVWIRKEYGA